MSRLDRIVHSPENYFNTMEITQLPPMFEGMVIRHINLLKFIGIDVFDESNCNPFKKYARITVFGSFLMCMLLGQVLYVTMGNKIGASFLDVVNAIPSVFIVIQACVKIWIFILKKNLIREIIIDVGNEWPDCSQEEKRIELQKWARKLKVFDNAFFRCTVVSLLCFAVSPMLITIYKSYTAIDAKYEFIVQVYFFCELNSNMKYAIVYIHQFITCIAFDICVYVSCDFVLVDLIFALSGLLSSVQIDLRNMKRSSIRLSSEDECNDIKKLVKTHQNLLRITEKLNVIFGLVIFSQVSFSSIVICCYGFMAFVADGMFLRNITASFGIMFAIFVLAWPGQLLIDTSSGVADAAYQCHWYERNNKFRKYISIMIARSQKPCQLSALGFSDLSLAMFSNVLSTSWSYLSLLNHMYKDFDL